MSQLQYPPKLIRVPPSQLEQITSQEFKSILQQKLTQLHLMKPVQQTQLEMKKGLSMKKNYPKPIKNALSTSSSIRDNTNQDRYAKTDINTQTHTFYKDSKSTPKKPPPEFRNSEYFQTKNPMFWSTEDQSPQVMGTKLSPIPVHIDKQRTVVTNDSNLPQQNYVTRPKPSSVAVTYNSVALPKIKRNVPSTTEQVNGADQTKPETSQAREKSQVMGRSISTPFIVKSAHQPLTSRSQSPKEQSKLQKPRLNPIQPKKQLNSPVNNNGSTSSRPAPSESTDTPHNDVPQKPKLSIKKKKAKQLKPMVNPMEEKIILRHTSFRAFINKINFTNNICISSPRPMNVPSYTYYIGKGNNSSLVRSAFKWRWWWTETTSTDITQINMSWTQLRQNDFLELLEQRDGFDGENYINLNESLQDCVVDVETESDSDFDNSRSKSVRVKVPTGVARSSLTFQPIKDLSQLKTQQAKPANYLYLRKVFNSKDLALLTQYMEKTGQKDTGAIFSDCTEQLLQDIKKVSTCQRTDSSKLQMHNHLENNWNLSNKKALFYNMRAYYEAIHKDYSNYLPLTFHIQEGLQDKEFEKLAQYYQCRQDEIKEQEEKIKAGQLNYFDRKNLKQKFSRNIWIVKPGEMTNRGTGITVCADMNEIMNLISSGQKHPNGKLKTYIVQQYIENPFLYNKRKFDIRCYMLMTSQNGILKGYWYQEGYIRTTSKEYSTKNFNIMIHLTNDAVQKKGEEYGKFESGNKISFMEFQRYLDLNYSEQRYSFFNDIYPKMRSLALDTIRSVYGKIDPKRRTNSFELFGLDFMIDDNFKLWLIEVNTNPCLELSCPLLSRIIPPLVENVLRVALDPIFPPPFIDEWPQNKKQFSPDNVLENNKFELVFDELIDYKQMKQILKNNGNTQIFDIEEMEEEEDDE